MVDKKMLELLSIFGSGLAAIGLIFIATGELYGYIINPLALDPFKTDAWVQFLVHNAHTLFQFGYGILFIGAGIYFLAGSRLRAVRKMNRFRITPIERRGL